MTKQVRSFFFTYNNYEENTANLILDSFDLRYGIIGAEFSKLGTPHLQGFIQLKNRKTLKSIGSMFPWHVEALKGTPEQAIAYCKKGLQDHAEWEALGLQGPNYGRGAQLWERGVQHPGPGDKTTTKDRWQHIYRQVQSHDQRLQEVGEEFPSEFVRYYRNLVQLRQSSLNHYQGQRSCYFIYGKAGVGKSRFCHENFPNAYLKDACTRWWDDYDGEPVVILDELETQMVSLGHYLKRWSDRYKIRGEVKGGHCNLGYKIFLVTSNTTLESLCKGDEILYSALARRFKEVEALSYTPETKTLNTTRGPLTRADIIEPFQPTIIPFLEGEPIILDNI